MHVCMQLTVFAGLYIVICTGGCQNGGTCILPEVCTCAPGWTGTNCETGEVYNGTMQILLVLCACTLKMLMSAMDIMSAITIAQI